MNADVIKILTEAADKLEQIRIGNEIFADEVVDKDNPVTISNHAYRQLWRQYESFERDPVMKKIFGSLLRIQIALALSDFHFRQRKVWEWWFMAVYRETKHWQPDKNRIPGTDKEWQPADPRNWRKAEEAPEGHFKNGVWIPIV